MIRRGLTLLELLVAMALTGILAWIALGMFSGESANFQRTREKVKMQSDARAAVRIMEEELRDAGYASRILGSSRISQAISKCSETDFTAAGEAIQAVNSGTLATGDQVAVRYFEIPASGTLAACGTGSASQFREVAYRLNGGRLERRFRKDPADATAAWVPFLENVVSFQAQYGMITAVNDYPTNLVPAKTTDMNYWSNAIGTPLTIGGTTTQVVLSGWTTSVRTAYLTTPIDTTRVGEAYKVSFDATPNAAFVDAANGYDTSWATSPLRVSLIDHASGAESDTVAFRVSPIADVPQHFEMFLEAASNTTTSSNPMHIGIRGRLRAGAASSGQTLALTNVVVQRANRAKYFSWLYAPTSAQLGQVAAIRLCLLVKTPQGNGEKSAPTFTGAQLGDTTLGTYTATGAAAKQSHILYQRIIPVVNNVL